MRSIPASLSLLAALVGGCGENAAPDIETPKPNVPEHVHGLGLNPRDGALFIATHSGLRRSARDGGPAVAVGGSRRDMKGFTVLGRDRFLASGHPGPGDEAPQALGLMLSRNAGKSWQPISLYGRADLHIIRPTRERLYAVDAGNGALLSTTNDGRSWRVQPPPGEFVDLAVDPRDPDHLVAAMKDGLRRSKDRGRSWRPLSRRVGFLAWQTPTRLVLVELSGTVAISEDGGRSFDVVGALEAAPVAVAHGRGRLFAALENASVWESRDGGRSWKERAMP
jgi:photosystem II stability/assembly factor-like uncharacterized protein